MRQQYGRANSGTVRHIVRSAHGYQNGDYRRALCGKDVMVVPLAVAIGGTCRLCMKSPDYNRQENDGEA